jgi:hypothetical protein
MRGRNLNGNTFTLQVKPLCPVNLLFRKVVEEHLDTFLIEALDGDEL